LKFLKTTIPNQRKKLFKKNILTRNTGQQQETEIRHGDKKKDSAIIYAQFQVSRLKKEKRKEVQLPLKKRRDIEKIWAMTISVAKRLE